MPLKDGIWATTEIRGKYPEARILMLTTFDGDTDIHRAVQAGAQGYVLKNSTRDQLIPALRAVARKIHSTRQGNPNAIAVSQIDPDSEEVQQLKSAAMPLLFQLREDQKEEVRKLARIIGLDKVASAI